MAKEETGLFATATGRFIITLAFALTACVLTRNAYGENPPSVSGPVYFSKEEILLGAESVYSQIEDINVSFSFNAVRGARSNLFFRSHRTAVIRGSKAYISHTYGADPDHSTSTFLRKAAFNGALTTTYIARSGSATIEAKRTRETRTKGSGFFDLMLMNESRPEADGRADQSLLSLLRTRQSHLRPALEEIDGHQCHVVDLLDESSNLPRMTAWIDCERGFLPLRQVYYAQPDYDAILMEFRIENAIELKQGLWFAVKGRKTVYPALKNVPELRSLSEHVMEVDGWKEGKPALLINQGVPDSFFELWLHVPPGTVVWDKDTGDQWMVKEGDYWGLADEVLETLHQESLQIIEHEVLRDSNTVPGEKEAGNSLTAAKKSRVHHDRFPAYPQETLASRNPTRLVVVLTVSLGLVAVTIITCLLVRKNKRKS
jgi:hypothetical protein